jgi:hypothetical protein
MVADDLPVIAPGEHPSISFDHRLDWLKSEVIKAKPHLIVMDLMQQFICTSNVNDYAETMTGINRLLDALTKIGYEGAFIAAFHGRKSTSVDQPFDDLLGSTALRGTFTTLILLKQDRGQRRYTIMSDQTEREEPWGEIEETTLICNDDGTLSLGRPTAELKQDSKDARLEADLQRVLSFISDQPGSETDVIIGSLAIAKARVLEIVCAIHDLLVVTGRGIKGDPKRYSLTSPGTSTSDPHTEAGAIIRTTATFLVPPSRSLRPPFPVPPAQWFRAPSP